MTIYDLIGFNQEEVNLVLQNIHKYYKTFYIKKSNGSTRVINAPSKQLKKIQQSILKNFLYKFKAHPNAYGFIKGRGAREGAKQHVNSKVLLCIDIKNFFYSIKLVPVANLFKYLLTKFPGKIDYNEDDIHNLAYLVTIHGSLPQGAPTSPAIANTYCFKLDRIFTLLAKEYNIQYTRYADDISFSSTDQNFLMSKLLPLIAKELKFWGFKLSSKKTRILKPYRRMVVTGIVVNKKLGTPKKVWKNIRAQIHNYKKQNLDIDTNEYTKLRGQIEWIKSLNSMRGTQLLKMLESLNIKK